MNDGDVADFGPFSYDPARGELRRHGEPRALPPRAADVLTHLVSRPGRLLLRDELVTWVWGSMGRASSDARLNSSVRRLRRALEDDALAPTYIETVPKRGYRFIAEVRWRSGARPSQRRRRSGVPAIPVLLGAALVAAAALWIPADAPTELPAGMETQYLRGRHLVTRGSREDVRSGRDLLREVTKEAPRLAGAWSGLATAEATLGRLVEAETFARRALDLDPTSAEAYRVVAEAALGLRWDLDEAEAHVLRSIELDPRAPLARSTHAYTLALRGRWEDAVSEARYSLSLDPMQSLVAGDLAYFLYWRGATTMRSLRRDVHSRSSRTWARHSRPCASRSCPAVIPPRPPLPRAA